MGRDDQTDSRGIADVGEMMDFSPTSVAEQLDAGGNLRTDRPVGAGPAPDEAFMAGDAEMD